MALGALGAIVLLIVATSGYGIGLNTDSVGYKTAADNLVGGDGLTWWGDPDFVVWPPLFPVVLAWGALISPLATEDVGLVVQLVLLVVILLETAVLLRRTVPDLRLRVLGILVVALAPVMLAMARMLWTEITFISIVLGALIALQRAVDDGDQPDPAAPGSSGARRSALRWRWVAASVVLVWLAFLTRYTGWSLLVTGGVTFLFLPATRPFRQRIRVAVAFAGAGVVVPAIWLARNRAVSGTLMGPRPTTDQSLPANAQDAVEVLGQYVSWYPGGLHLALGALAMLGVLALLVAAWRWADPPRGLVSTIIGPRGQLLPVAVFAGVYVVMLLVTRTLVAFGEVSDRLLAPVFVPLVVIALSWLGAILASPVVTRRMSLGAVSVVAVWVLLLAATSARLSINQAGNGVVLEGADYERAPLASMVHDAEAAGCRLYTNSRPAVFLWTGTVADQAPRRTKHWSSERVGDVATFERTVERERVCLLWVGLDESEHILTPSELQERFELVALREAGSAALYEVRP